MYVCVCVCVFVSSISCQYARRMRRGYIVCLALPHFFTLHQVTSRFGGELLNTKCVFWFSPQRLFETFLILRRKEWDIIIHVQCVGLHVKYPLFLSDFNETWIFSTNFQKSTQITNFMKIHPVGAELFQADGQTDMNSRFSQLCERT